MSLTEIIILAIALGIDCMVVSFSQGLIFKNNRLFNSMILALTMGIFQGGMPFIGYFGINPVVNFIAPFSKLFVFAIFMFLGLKFIIEAFQEKKEIQCIDIKCLMFMGIATSIDALVSGVSLNLTSAPLIFSVVVIGVMSFLMSLSGFWFGIFFKRFPSKFLEISGGIILIFLALKNLNF